MPLHVLDRVFEQLCRVALSPMFGIGGHVGYAAERNAARAVPHELVIYLYVTHDFSVLEKYRTLVVRV